ncbi:unnamed protein product [Vitrella brassicaformis CCMP3155]|uniref:Uncharacterized protein n=2 Tax=Vitrella brassicaformis TaxID=1169539 RepID=A0A0G4F946_VITBC|nr:unnamed protein product [Vitrella brassicaformis CCMP3155]|eukprot:CEM09127.1 unnamed protein product [Vitrella brassicaformis CCMP3155]
MKRGYDTFRESNGGNEDSGGRRPSSARRLDEPLVNESMPAPPPPWVPPGGGFFANGPPMPPGPLFSSSPAPQANGNDSGWTYHRYTSEEELMAAVAHVPMSPREAREMERVEQQLRARGNPDTVGRMQAPDAEMRAPEPPVTLNLLKHWRHRLGQQAPTKTDQQSGPDISVHRPLQTDAQLGAAAAAAAGSIDQQDVQTDAMPAEQRWWLKQQSTMTPLGGAGSRSASIQTAPARTVDVGMGFPASRDPDAFVAAEVQTEGTGEGEGGARGGGGDELRGLSADQQRRLQEWVRDSLRGAVVSEEIRGILASLDTFVGMLVTDPRLSAAAADVLNFALPDVTPPQEPPPMAMAAEEQRHPQPTPPTQLHPPAAPVAPSGAPSAGRGAQEEDVVMAAVPEQDVVMPPAPAAAAVVVGQGGARDGVPQVNQGPRNGGLNGGASRPPVSASVSGETSMAANGLSGMGMHLVSGLQPNEERCDEEESDQVDSAEEEEEEEEEEGPAQGLSGLLRRQQPAVPPAVAAPAPAAAFGQGQPSPSESVDEDEDDVEDDFDDEEDGYIDEEDEDDDEYDRLAGSSADNAIDLEDDDEEEDGNNGQVGNGQGHHNDDAPAN